MYFRPNVRTKTTKILEENIAENLHELGLSKEFLNTTLKTYSIEEKNRQIFFFRIKIFKPQNIALRNIRPLNTKERWSKYIESEKKKEQFLHEGAEIRMALNFLNATLES